MDKLSVSKNVMNVLGTIGTLMQGSRVLLILRGDIRGKFCEAYPDWGISATTSIPRPSAP